MSRLLSIVVFALSCAFCHAALSAEITDLVTFGDSYTDVGNSADGGVAWPVYAAGYAGVNLHPYAKSGATCSNKLTPRPSPPVFESQLPAYYSDINNGTELNADKTLYTLWIGTNDLGKQALLTDFLDATLVEVTDCMVNWVKDLYDNGARNFLFQNVSVFEVVHRNLMVSHQMIPLEKTIMYSANGYLTRYYPYNHNATEWAITMRDLTHAANDLTKLKLQALIPSLSEAHVGKCGLLHCTHSSTYI
jgi:phospholipase/lecithinase/hemolysin